uniref:FecR protein domain-containing protein n=1 Tax=Oscillatoriales cyanobacterium SpSt-402 TaxID=2282168 RepID=A0A832M635_9CYAN
MSVSSSARISGFPAHSVIWSILVGCGFTIATTIIYFAWASQPLQRVKIAEVVSKTDANGVFVDSKPVKAGTEVATGQQILTLENARVGLQQAEMVLVRLGNQSSVTLERDCLQLGEGQIVVSDTQGCMGAAIVRGQDAVYVLERLGTLGEVKVLSGRVEVSVPSNPAVQSISLAANQKVILSLTGDEIGPVRLMLPAEVDSILQGELFQGFQLALANQTTIAGLPPSAIAPNPTPTASVKPTPAPTQPQVAQQPPVKATPKPSVSNPPRPVAITTQESSHPVYSDYRAGDSYTKSGDSGRTIYNRAYRRRRMQEPSYEQYAYRRKVRSPYSASNYRRRPSYSPPSYSSSEYAAPAMDLPPVHEAPQVEVPPPTELPPATLPDAGPLPPPVMVEPPLEAPSLKSGEPFSRHQ